MQPKSCLPPVLTQVLSPIPTSACARNGVHYVDITGETPWILHIIKK